MGTQPARPPPTTPEEVAAFIADMENPALPPPANNQLLRLNEVIERWERKIANGEAEDMPSAPPTLTRQNAQHYEFNSDCQ